MAQQIQKEALMEKLEEDWNGLQLFFFFSLTVFQSSLLLFEKIDMMLWRHTLFDTKDVILSFTGNLSSFIANKDS